MLESLLDDTNPDPALDRFEPALVALCVVLIDDLVFQVALV
jgi:hypothetical protein